ncbi:MAG: hypothetical protein ACO1RT_09240, partial [Planctomycetaceae bacterium]
MELLMVDEAIDPMNDLLWFQQVFRLEHIGNRAGSLFTFRRQIVRSGSPGLEVLCSAVDDGFGQWNVTDALGEIGRALQVEIDKP